MGRVVHVALCAVLMLHGGCGRFGYNSEGATGDGGNGAGGAPLLLSASFVAYDKLEVVFDRAVDPAIASEVQHYSLSPDRPSSIAVADAEVNGGGTTITLTLSKNHLPLAYALTVEAIGTDGTTAGPVTTTVVGERSRLIFQTSETGGGNLSEWAAADGGSIGAAVGDGICANLAAAQGLVGTFAAALSDTTADAPCRVEGLTGAYPACLGSDDLTGGPWINAVGEFVTANYGDGLAYDLYDSVAYTETGAPSMVNLSWSATYSNGTFSAGDSCMDWTSATGIDTAIVGFPTHAVSPLGSYTWLACAAQLSLVCVQTDAGGFSDVPLPGRSGKVAFVTSTLGPGDLARWTGSTQSGVAGADEVCNARAVAGGLPGTYVAWVSDSVDDAYCRLIGTGGMLAACNSSIDVDGPWVTTRGALVAVRASDFRTPPLSHPIHCDEFGEAVVDRNTYTGTNEGGGSTGLTCNNWESAGPDLGTVGQIQVAYARMWTDSSERDCSTLARLYCLQVD